MILIIIYYVTDIILLLLGMAFVYNGAVIILCESEKFEGFIIFLLGFCFLYGFHNLIWGDLNESQRNYIAENINKPEYKKCKEEIIKIKNVTKIDYEHFELCIKKENYQIEINKMKDGIFTKNKENIMQFKDIKNEEDFKKYFENMSLNDIKSQIEHMITKMGTKCLGDIYDYNDFLLCSDNEKIQGLKNYYYRNYNK